MVAIPKSSPTSSSSFGLQSVYEFGDNRSFTLFTLTLKSSFCSSLASILTFIDAP
jgi:hypothetical protein